MCMNHWKLNENILFKCQTSHICTSPEMFRFVNPDLHGVKKDPEDEEKPRWEDHHIKDQECHQSEQDHVELLSWDYVLIFTHVGQ